MAAKSFLSTDWWCLNSLLYLGQHRGFGCSHIAGIGIPSIISEVNLYRLANVSIV